MITPIPINEPHILAFRLSGNLTEEDYKTFQPELENYLSQEKKLSVLIKLESFEDGSGKSAWKEISSKLASKDNFLRIAIVGEERLKKLLGEFGNLFKSTPIHYFSEEEQALNWLNEVKAIAAAEDYAGYRHILVASDFSSYAEQALGKAIQLAQPFDAKITLFHAAEILSSEIYPEMGELSIPVMVDNPELTRKQLERLKNRLQESNSHVTSPPGMVETVVREGHPVETIREFSLENGVDLIVMGSHGRRGLAKLLGSSTNGVINHAPCDVLVTASRP